MIIGSSKDGEVANIENNQEKENLDRKMNGWFLTSRMWLWGISDWRECSQPPLKACSTTKIVVSFWVKSLKDATKTQIGFLRAIYWQKYT